MTETAVLAGGCFWCLEAAYSELRGVRGVESGYTGGAVADPSYVQVCTGTTGHAEAVRITFDPSEITHRDLLEVFFTIHDPTTRDRQGNDVGPQYRSAIFYASDAQRAAAEAMIAELQRERVFKAPIVTEVAPLGAFYPADDHHRDYYRRNASEPYCQFVIAPKLAKLREKHRARLRAAAT